MIAVPMSVKIDSLWLYLKIKLLVLGLILVVNVAEDLLGIVSRMESMIVFASLVVAVIPALVLYVSLKKNRLFAPLGHISVTIDLIMIFVTTYFHGGVENSWLFLPPLVIFIAAYMFDIFAGVAFALFSYALLVLMAYLQYSNTLPTFRLFDLPPEHWRNAKYLTDYLAGSFAYYILAAFSVGTLTRLAAKRAERADEFRERLEKAKTEDDEIKEKVRKAKVEILVKNAELERQEVYSAGRQLKLVDLRRRLEEMKRGG